MGSGQQTVLSLWVWQEEETDDGVGEQKKKKKRSQKREEERGSEVLHEGWSWLIHMKLRGKHTLFSFSFINQLRGEVVDIMLTLFLYQS